MKVGIITFQCVDNYGAMLQCYALKTFIERKGHTVKVINYSPKYLTKQNRIFVSPFRNANLSYKINKNKGIHYAFYRSALSFIKAVAQNLLIIQKIQRHSNFVKFRNDNLNLTNSVKSHNDVKALANNFDLIVCGSDQIWNPEITNGAFDSMYFGSFASEKTKIISYAASAAMINTYNAESFVKLLKRFQGISLRESTYALDITKSLGKDVHIDVDPTMLLSRSDYQKISSYYLSSNEYILIYTLEDAQSQDRAYEAVNSLIKTTGIKTIIDISSKKTDRIGGNYFFKGNAGPKEFIGFIENSCYVVTNSFHGTVFSIIFDKQFFVIPHSKRGIRITELMGSLALNDRIVDGEIAEDNISNINYSLISNRLEERVLRSQEYLDECLKG